MTNDKDCIYGRCREADHSRDEDVTRCGEIVLACPRLTMDAEEMEGELAR